MGDFAIVVLGLGLITLGSSLIVSVVWGVQLPPGITELSVTVLALVGRALVNIKSAGNHDSPPNRTRDPIGPVPNGATGELDHARDLGGGPSGRT
jgi:hypothetical protein